MFLEQIEPGVDGLRPRFWTERSGEWWMSFVSMAWKNENGDRIDFAIIPINPSEYVLAPTEWVKAESTLGIDQHLYSSIYNLLRHKLYVECKTFNRFYIMDNRSRCVFSESYFLHSSLRTASRS